MLPFEFVIAGFAGLVTAAATTWAIARRGERDPIPYRAYWWRALTQVCFALIALLRLVASWESLSGGWRLSGLLAFGLCALSVVLVLSHAANLRRRHAAG